MVNKKITLKDILTKSILDELELQRINFIFKDGDDKSKISRNEILYANFFQKYQAKHHYIIRPYRLLKTIDRYFSLYYDYKRK